MFGFSRYGKVDRESKFSFVVILCAEKNWKIIYSLFSVTPCAGAKEALSLLLEKKDGFDIILTDLHMPDMDGLQLLDCIRSMDAIDHVPVIRKSLVGIFILAVAL